jgi:hypothetical protein
MFSNDPIDAEGNLLQVGDRVTWIEERRFLEEDTIVSFKGRVAEMATGRRVLSSNLRLKPGSRRGNPRVVSAPRNVNPLTDEESAQELSMATGAERASERIGLPRGSGFAAGMARGTRQTVQRRGSKRAAKAATKAIIKSGTKRKNPAKRTAAGELTKPMLTMLRNLRRSNKKKDTVTFAQASTLKALKARGLVTELKTVWRINAKGKKATAGKLRRQNPRPAAKKSAAPARAPRKKPVKHAKRKSRPKARRGNQPEICKHTLPLERGSKDKLTVCYPKSIFSSLKAAVVNIQKELRAKYKRLSKAPRITQATWKFSDAGKTKGRWHFTAKKAAA